MEYKKIASRKKKAIIIHSGGMDSSICLALAINEFGKTNVLSMSFNYHQRHSSELQQAKKICTDWNVDHVTINLSSLQGLTQNALMNSDVEILQQEGKPPNTLVIGRNGLMARLGAIHAHHFGAHCLYMGVLEMEEANSGYRDCSRHYMDLKQQILRIDLNDNQFEIRTPLIKMTKKETLEIAKKLGILEYLLKETISCYQGIRFAGCKSCPACHLRNAGIIEYTKQYPDFTLPYSLN